jgi:hypothetical protein
VGGRAEGAGGGGGGGGGGAPRRRGGAQDSARRPRGSPCSLRGGPLSAAWAGGWSTPGSLAGINTWAGRPGRRTAARCGVRRRAGRDVVRGERAWPGARAYARGDAADPATRPRRELRGPSRRGAVGYGRPVPRGDAERAAPARRAPATSARCSASSASRRVRRRGGARMADCALRRGGGVAGARVRAARGRGVWGVQEPVLKHQRSAGAGRGRVFRRIAPGPAGRPGRRGDPRASSRGAGRRWARWDGRVPSPLFTLLELLCSLRASISLANRRVWCVRGVEGVSYCMLFLVMAPTASARLKRGDQFARGGSPCLAGVGTKRK